MNKKKCKKCSRDYNDKSQDNKCLCKKTKISPLPKIK